MMEKKLNSKNLLRQAIVGKISSPSMLFEAGQIGGYVTTWDGKPKIGFGLGGIKYNVKIGDRCFGWQETELLEPDVSLCGIDYQSTGPPFQRPEGTALAFIKLSCVGNKVVILEGDGKGSIGVVTGKGGTVATRSHVYAHFPDSVLEKLNIGDKVRVEALGTGLSIESFEGRLFNMSPSFFKSLTPEINNGVLTLPVVKEIPSYAMGQGVGGTPAEWENWCIQTCPPHLVNELELMDLRMGDIVACRDVLMSYGKGFYKGAISVGIIMTGASDIAGNGLGVMAIASSKRGNIDFKISTEANIVNYLKMEV